jgi:hypothetical protein
MTRRRAAYTFLALALCTLYWGCANGRGGSEVVGITVAQANATPIPNATVIALKQKGQTYYPVDTTTSGPKGRFVFSNLDIGTYKIYGEAVRGDTTLVGLDSNIVISSIASKGEEPTRVDAGNVVLLPQGTISGTVIIDDDNHSGVECYTLDSAFNSHSKSDGSYTILHVAAGIYTVCFFYAGYVPYLYPNVEVKTGIDTKIDTVFLQHNPSGNPTAPRGLIASYDTVHGLVALRWNSVRVSDLRDYIVYRKNATTMGEPPPFDTVIAADTVFMDTVFRSFTDTVEKSLVYQVKAVDNTNNQSPFSDAVSVLAVPPSTVRPVVRSISADTAVEYGGSVRCRVTFINAFNDFKVYLMQGAGSPWVPISHSTEGVADTSFSTGTSSSWGTVRFRIKFSSDSLDTSFTVHVKPRTVAIVSADSTDSSVTVRWNRSPDSDFKEYELHRKAAVDSAVFRSTSIADTVFTYKTLSMTPADYWVAVADTEGAQSTFDSAMVKRLCIVNTPPRFTTNPATLPGTAPVGEEYSVTFAATDRNNDTLSFALLSPDSAIMNGNTIFWTPAIEELGAQRCTVTVHDNHGGIDTLVWAVSVAAHGIWANADSLIGARRQCGVGAIGEVMYAVGGSINKVNSTLPMALKTVEAYDAITDSWTAKAPLVNARWAPFIGVWNGKIYVMGGFSDRSYSIAAIEEYDPAANTWSTISQKMPFPRGHGASCVVGNKLYCLGGKAYDTALKSEVVVKSIEIFDLSARTWSKGPDMLFARADHQALLCNGKICIIGGYGGPADSIAVINNEEEMVSMVEWYDPQANRCDSIASLFTPRCNFAAAALGDSLFIMGGYRSLTLSDDDVVLKDVELLQPSARWNGSSTGLPVSLHSAQAIAMQGRIYCIGGVIESVTTRSVLVYYP